MAPQRRADARSRPSPRSFDADVAPYRAAVYARVSGDGQTIATQIATLVPYVQRRGWQLVAPPETYQDDGISAADGHLEQRAGLLRLLADAARGAFDVVAVVNIDRFSRADDLIERYTVLGQLQRLGILIADAHTGSVYDLNTEDGALYVGLGAHFAARDRRKILEQMERGRRYAIGENRKPRGVDPFGYSLGPDGRLVEREDEAAVVREIFARVAAGEACARIAWDMNLRRVPLRERRNRAAHWTRPRVYAIARSPRYRGALDVVRREDLSIEVPALVTESLWHEAQSALSSRRSTANTGRAPRILALAQGRARCAICGSRVGLSRTQKKGRVIAYYYACMRRLRPPTPEERCAAPYQRVEDVDATLWALIEDLLADGWRRLADEIRAAQARDPNDERTEVERLGHQVAQLERAQGVALASHRRGTISRAVLDRELRAIKSELDEALAALAVRRERVRVDRWTPEDLEITVEHVRARLSRCTPAERRDLVRVLIPGHGRRVVTIGDGEVSAVACLDPRDLDLLGVRFSTEKLTPSRSLPVLEFALAAA